MKEIALACTGGGVKSAINIGVIRALEELNIKITAISGASIGACVAVLYAMGYTPQEMLELYKKNIKTYGKFTLPELLIAPISLAIHGGLKNPKIFSKTVEDICNKTGFNIMSDFKIPVIIPALDITKRETVYYSSRPLKEFNYYMDRPISEAIKSSSSLPVIFTPNEVKIDGKNHHMMDGGITNNTSILPLKDFSDFVVGIESKYYNTKERQKIHFLSAFTETFQAMRRSSLFYQKREADLWIEVDVKKSRVFDNIDAIDYCEKCGYNRVIELAKNGCFDIPKLVK